jgi:predicted phage-related endonuclease
MTVPVEKHQPSDRDAWRSLRRQDITASQIGGLLPGIHPYVTPYQLFAYKTGRLAPDDDIDTPAMARGRALEPLAAQFAAEQLPGAKIETNQLQYWRDPHSRIGATPDLLIENERGFGVVQLKSIEPSIYAKTWHDGEPPVWIALQALTEAKLTGAAWAAVGVLRVGFRVDFDLMPIPLHEGMWARLQAEAAAFWRMVDLNTPPPPDFGRDAATIAALNATVDNASIDLSDDGELIAAIIERERLKKATKDFDARAAELEGLIRHKAGSNAIVLAGDYRLTLREERRAGYTVPPGVRRPLRVKRIRETANA